MIAEFATIVIALVGIFEGSVEVVAAAYFVVLIGYLMEKRKVAGSMAALGAGIWVFVVFGTLSGRVSGLVELAMIIVGGVIILAAFLTFLVEEVSQK